MMMANLHFQRSGNIKEVIRVKAKKYSGYFNPECKRFAIDPRVTTFSDLEKILSGAFNLSGTFQVSYLCRDDSGNNMYISMLNDWDLDAAFITSSDPYLWLKVDAICNKEQPLKEDLKEALSGSSTSFTVTDAKGLYSPRTWLVNVGGAITKMLTGLADSYVPTEGEEPEDIFPIKPPLDDSEFRKFLDSEGRLVRPEDLRLRIYHGGIEPSLRKVVWRMLLNIFPELLSGKERLAYIEAKTKHYFSLLSQWQAQHNDEYVETLSRMIWKDVVRTDRSHAFFGGTENNPNLISLHNILLTYGLSHKEVRYCQGMSDIASPILAVMGSEAQAYVCFCGAMVRLQNNFSSSGETMSKKFEHLATLLKCHDRDYFEFLKSMGADNMYFCYRWLLLELKREFDFDDALMVMEVMWSSLPPQTPENDLYLGALDLKGCSIAKSTSFPDITVYKKFPRDECSFPITCCGETASQTGTASLKLTTFPNECRSNSLCQLEEAPHQSLWSLGLGGHNHMEIKYSLIPKEDSDVEDELPSPKELGGGNPFLLFICLSILDSQKRELMRPGVEYDDLVMHFDRLSRKHPVNKVLSKAVQLFASYLRSLSKEEEEVIT